MIIAVVKSFHRGMGEISQHNGLGKQRSWFSVKVYANAGAFIHWQTDSFGKVQGDGDADGSLKNAYDLCKQYSPDQSPESFVMLTWRYAPTPFWYVSLAPGYLQIWVCKNILWTSAFAGEKLLCASVCDFRLSLHVLLLTDTHMLTHFYAFS